MASGDAIERGQGMQGATAAQSSQSTQTPQGMEDAERIRVVCAYAVTPQDIRYSEWTLPSGATVGNALELAGVAVLLGADWSADWSVSVWGKVQPLHHALRDGDRVELCRALRVDPKEARRQRYRPKERTAPAKARRVG